MVGDREGACAVGNWVGSWVGSGVVGCWEGVEVVGECVGDQ